QIIGAVRAERIFRYVITSPELLEAVGQQLVVKRPYTIRNDVLVKDAYQKLRQGNTSRLIVVDTDKKLIGILTRNDLKRVFLTPSSRQRFSKTFGNVGQSMYDEEKLKRSDLPAKKFIKATVLTSSDTAPVIEVIKKLVKSKRNSIVLLNASLRPAGLVSHRDILLAIAKTSNEPVIPIVMEKPRFVGESTIQQVNRMLSDMGTKINTILPVKRIEISFKEGRNDAGKLTLVESTLKALFYTRDSFVATVSNRNILISVKEALRRVHKMVRRSSDKNKQRR
ncbi:MAG: CBS domain-containing protein, partial [Candidatus Roizmanbacteria bacterium]|nr:CBS domain-containing protein [Candidatus Roizmanbacteria bacterium]